MGALFSCLGSFVHPLLSTAFKATRPIAKQTFKKLGKESIKIGGDILTDVVSGQNLRESVTERGCEGLMKGKKIMKKGTRQVLKKTTKAIQWQVGGQKKATKKETLSKK